MDGPLLETRFDFKRTRTIAGAVNLTFDISAKANIVGLGYSFVEVQEHSIGLDLRLWVLATPVDGTLIDMTLVSQAREIRNPKRMIAGLGFLPVRLRAPIINRFMVMISAEAGCASGRGNLEPQAVSSAPTALPFGRENHDLQAILRSVLS